MNLRNATKTLSEGAGLNLDPDYVRDKYNGVEFSGPKQPALSPTQNPTGSTTKETNFAVSFADPDGIAQLADQLDDVTAPVVEAMFADIERILETSRDVKEFSERLLQFAGEQDNKDLAKLIAGGGAVAAMMGMDDA